MPKKRASNRVYKKKRVLTPVRAHRRHVVKKVPVYRAVRRK